MSNSNALISVVVPVYNTGHYLYKCINSLTSQTYTNIEILLIDDGSDKDTANICDELSTSDSRIHVIHKINEGPSIARNIGISLAQGEYISFVDSDDYVSNDYFEVLYNALTNTDAQISCCKAIYSSNLDYHFQKCEKTFKV